MLLGTVAVMIIAGCTRETAPSKPAAAPPPAQQTSMPPSMPAQPSGRMELEIYPSSVNRTSVLNLSAPAIDAAVPIQWYVDGSPVVSESRDRFSCEKYPKGSSIQARAMVDGHEILSNIVQIGNTPPELTSVKVLPEIFKPGDTLMIDAAATDVDNDTVTILYAWVKNGASAGAASRIEGTLTRGDTVKVTVTPFDGQNTGEPVQLIREIKNLPPSFEEQGHYTFSGSLYTYQVRASDPDGDRVAYSLENPERDMTIEPASGMIVWTVPEGFSGERQVAIIADDGNGGKARYSATLSVR